MKDEENSVLVRPEMYDISKEYFDGNIPRMDGESMREFDLFKAFVWTNLTVNRFAVVITEMPEKIQAYIDSRKQPGVLLKFANERKRRGITSLANKWNWLERRSNHRYKIAQQVNEDISFQFLNDSLENFTLAQKASKKGLNLMNELLELGLSDPIHFNGRRFSDLASGMRIVFDEARLFSGNPTENIAVKNKKTIEADDTKAKLDNLLEGIEEIKTLKEKKMNDDIIDAEIVEK